MSQLILLCLLPAYALAESGDTYPNPLFKSIDTDKNNQVNLDELKVWLKVSNVYM